MAGAALLGLSPGVFAGDWRCETGGSSTEIVLTFTGVITSREEGGDFSKLKSALKGCKSTRSVTVLKPILVIHLNSGGGEVDEALAISRFLVDKLTDGSYWYIKTRVLKGGFCISACTFMFLAGNVREVDLGASFEPHGFSGYSGGDDISKIRELKKEQQDKKLRHQDVSWDEAYNRSRMELMMQLFEPEGVPQKIQLFPGTEPSWEWLSSFSKNIFRQAAELVAKKHPGLKFGGGDYIYVQSRYFFYLIVESWDDLSGEQRDVLIRIEKTIRAIVPELERDAVMNHYLKRDISESERSRFLSLHAERLVQALIDSIPTTKPMNAAIRAEVTGNARRAFAEVRDGSVKLFRDQLLPYFAARAQGQFELDPLVRLMFSTSIFYTRALTREELCDFNILNLPKICKGLE